MSEVKKFAYCKMGSKIEICALENGMYPLKGYGDLSGIKLGIEALSDKPDYESIVPDIRSCDACVNRGGPTNCIFRVISRTLH